MQLYAGAYFAFLLVFLVFFIATDNDLANVVHDDWHWRDFDAANLTVRRRHSMRALIPPTSTCIRSCRTLDIARVYSKMNIAWHVNVLRDYKTKF